jgi:hypothetical protein
MTTRLMDPFPSFSFFLTSSSNAIFDIAIFGSGCSLDSPSPSSPMFMPARSPCIELTLAASFFAGTAVLDFGFGLAGVGAGVGAGAGWIFGFAQG